MLKDLIQEILEEFGEQATAEMINRLRGFGKNASGNLINSLGYQLTDNELVFTGADYAIYVDKGRRPGKMPPISALLPWLRLRGIPEEAAFPIAKSIGRYGIAPTNFISTSVTRRQKQLERKLAKALEQSIIVQLNND